MVISVFWNEAKKSRKSIIQITSCVEYDWKILDGRLHFNNELIKTNRSEHKNNEKHCWETERMPLHNFVGNESNISGSVFW